MIDILKWNKATQEWEILVDGDQFSGDLVQPTFAEDVEITDSSKGVILTSATKRWRLTVNDSGTLIITEIILP